MQNEVQIIFTDLDGTLLNSEKKISEADLGCLYELGRDNIVRVIATGRSLYSFGNLFQWAPPVDYLIFSNGAGVLGLDDGTLLQSSALGAREIRHIAAHLIEKQVDFMVHHAVPDNHHFTYYTGNRNNRDFRRRVALYDSFADTFTTLNNLPKKSAQVIAIFPADMARFTAVAEGLERYAVTRTTSPLDGKSIWMEILPQHVSKGMSAEWLCTHLGLCRSATVGIGNDYNDLSLLQYTQYSYLVANAPIDLHEKFILTPSNDNDGFSHAAKSALAAARTAKDN